MNRLWDLRRGEAQGAFFEGDEEGHAGMNVFPEMMSQDGCPDFILRVMGEDEAPTDEMNAVFLGPTADGPGGGLDGGWVIAIVACHDNVLSVNVAVGTMIENCGWVCSLAYLG